MKASFSDGAITREQAGAIPYASMGYRINGSREAMLILATDNGDLLWTSASHIVLTTRDGRVVRSVGLPHDIGGTVAKNASLPAPGDATKGSYRSTRLLDFPDSGMYGAILDCTTRAASPQTISIIGSKISTIRIDEACQSKNPRWSFTDNYWVDARTGFVWHSIQHLHPNGTIIQTEIFRPPE